MSWDKSMSLADASRWAISKYIFWGRDGKDKIRGQREKVEAADIILCSLYAIQPWGHPSHYSHHNFVYLLQSIWHMATNYLEERVFQICWRICAKTSILVLGGVQGLYSLFISFQSQRCTYPWIRNTENPGGKATITSHGIDCMSKFTHLLKT